MNRLINLICLAALTTMFCGCKQDNLPKTVPAEGVVTLDGAPIEGATVIFIAEQGSTNASGATDASGKFALKSFDEKSGALPGSYKVELNKTLIESAGKSGENQGDVTLKYGLPKKYANFLTSGLKISLGEEGNKEINFDLKSK